jgi:molybdopterin-guanine dinucleotide biosynthesis protein A
MGNFAAVVLSGGAGRRLGGADKAALAVGGRPMRDRVLAAAAAAGAAPCVVVGPSGDLPPGVLATRESPPGGGPVAAAAAGLALLPGDTETVALLAADLPLLTASALGTLRDAGSTTDGALFVDGDGRRQLLCGVWRVSAVRRALAALGDPAGASMRALVSGLHAVEVVWTESGPPPWFDCDTDDDIRKARRWVGEEGDR